MQWASGNVGNTAETNQAKTKEVEITNTKHDWQNLESKAQHLVQDPPVEFACLFGFSLHTPE